MHFFRFQPTNQTTDNSFFFLFLYPIVSNKTNLYQIKNYTQLTKLTRFINIINITAYLRNIPHTTPYRTNMSTKAALLLSSVLTLATAQNPHYPVYCKANGYCHVPGLPDSCTSDYECQTPWYPSSYCQSGGSCHLEPPPKCTKDSDCNPKNNDKTLSSQFYAPVSVSKICVENAAGFVMHFDLKDLDTDEISQDSGTFDIDQSKCLNLNDVAHISNNDLIMCRAHAVAGESNDCTDAVRFSVNSTETATFQCKGTTLDYSCTLN